jgi:hypothetical protein
MAGNIFVKNALVLDKHAGGRPAKFKTRLELIAAIQEYFDYCDNRMLNVYVKDLGENMSIGSPAPYTLSGLARFIGVDRDTILRYSKKDEFYGTIQAARMKIEEDNETRLLEGKNQAGAIFALKNNHGWVDKRLITSTKWCSRY